MQIIKNFENSDVISQIKEIPVSTCSKCGLPNSRDPARCCIDGDFNGGQVLVEIPEVKGRFYSDYFEEGKIFRGADIENKFISWIYSGESYRIAEFIKTLRRVVNLVRDGKSHNIECEYAIGNSCICWCGEKYHGWKGENLV